MPQQGATPAARAEGADRRQRQHLGVQRDDRSVRGEVVGGRAGRRGHQHAVADQLADPFAAVDHDAQLGGLMGLAQQRHLVDGQRGLQLALAAGGRHGEGMDDRLLGSPHALDQPLLDVVVHQETDRSAVHAVDRMVEQQGLVQGLQHEAVAAQGDDHVGVRQRSAAIAGLEALERFLGLGAVARDEGEAGGVLAHRASRVTARARGGRRWPQRSWDARRRRRRRGWLLRSRPPAIRR